MPNKTQKNKKTGRRIFQTVGSPVPMTIQKNNTRKIIYKLPLGLLQPKNILKAKQKNVANTARAIGEERRKRKEAQERFAAQMRADRARMASEPVSLLKAFENNEKGFKPSVKARGPGSRGSSPSRTIPPNLLRMMRGGPAPPPAPKASVNAVMKSASSNKTIRKANLLKIQQAMKKGKLVGKFWDNNSNSSSNNDKGSPSMSKTMRKKSYQKMKQNSMNSSNNNNKPKSSRHINLPFYDLE